MRAISIAVTAFFIVLAVAGCGGSGGKIEVTQIFGPNTVAPGDAVQYSCSGTANDVINFQWAVNPPDAGSFTGTNNAEGDEPGEVIGTTWFIAGEDQDGSTARILSLAYYASGDPVVRNKDITITDDPNAGNDRPEAAAHVNRLGYHLGDTIQFYDDSTDPDGVNDIVKWEWDFAYDPAGEFVAHSEDQNPQLTATVLGTYDVMLRVTDSGGLTDMLDDPIKIWITEEGWSANWQSGIDILDMAVDDDGNVVICGKFTEPADLDFGDGIDNQAPVGGSDSILIKFDEMGNQLWTRFWGGPDQTTNEGAYEVAVDGSGNVFVAGGIGGTVDMDPGAGIWNVNATTYYATYTSMFDPNGNFIAAAAWDNRQDYYEADLGLAVTDSSIYVCGTFYDTVDFNPGPGEALAGSTGAGPMGYLTAFDKNGIHQWVKAWDASESLSCTDLAAGENGQVYVTGYFEGVSDLDPGTGVDLQGPGGFTGLHMFLSCFSQNGLYNWGRTWEGSSANVTHHVTYSDIGNIYISGRFDQLVDFDPGDGTDFHGYTGLFGTSLFITAYNTSGDYLWAVDMVAGDEWFDLVPFAIATDDTGNVYASHQVEGIMDLDPGDGEFLVQKSQNNTAGIFLSMFDSSGEFIGARTWAVDDDYPDATAELPVIATGPDSGIHLSGRYTGTVDFDPGPDTYYPPVGLGRFLIKMYPSGTW